ncbi:MAG: hypothetical protein U0736_16415 [Gemmataceae bacterium]
MPNRCDLTWTTCRPGARLAVLRRRPQLYPAARRRRAGGVTLPHALIEGPLTWPGQHAALGAAHDPLLVTQDPSSPAFRWTLSLLPAGADPPRLEQRRVCSIAWPPAARFAATSSGRSRCSPQGG